MKEPRLVILENMHPWTKMVVEHGRAKVETPCYSEIQEAAVRIESGLRDAGYAIVPIEPSDAARTCAQAHK